MVGGGLFVFGGRSGFMVDVSGVVREAPGVRDCFD